MPNWSPFLRKKHLLRVGSQTNTALCGRVLFPRDFVPKPAQATCQTCYLMATEGNNRRGK